MSPNGVITQSIVTAEVKLPNVFKEACDAHTFLSLASGSLYSVGQLCDDGCEAYFNNNICTITKMVSYFSAELAPPTSNSGSLTTSNHKMLCIMTNLQWNFFTSFGTTDNNQLVISARTVPCGQRSAPRTTSGRTYCFFPCNSILASNIQFLQCHWCGSSTLLTREHNIVPSQITSFLLQSNAQRSFGSGALRHSFYKTTRTLTNTATSYKKSRVNSIIQRRHQPPTLI